MKNFIEDIQIRPWNVAYPSIITYTISVGRGLGRLTGKTCLLKISCILIIYIRVRDASITQHCGVIPVHDGTSHSIFFFFYTLTRMPFLHFPIIYKAETNTYKSYTDHLNNSRPFSCPYITYKSSLTPICDFQDRVSLGLETKKSPKYWKIIRNITKIQCVDFFYLNLLRINSFLDTSLNTCLKERSTWIFWSNYVLNETDKVTKFFQNGDFFRN